MKPEECITLCGHHEDRIMRQAGVTNVLLCNGVKIYRSLFSCWENLSTPVDGKSEKHASHLGLPYLQRLIMFEDAE